MLNDVEIFERSRKLWGLAQQIKMLAEEAAELTVESLHITRAGRDTPEGFLKWAGEVADVEFMLAEMRYYFPQLDGEVKRIRAEKAERLSKRILEAEARKAGP